MWRFCRCLLLVPSPDTRPCSEPAPQVSISSTPRNIKKLEDVAEAFRDEYKPLADGTFVLDLEGTDPGIKDGDERSMTHSVDWLWGYDEAKLEETA